MIKRKAERKTLTKPAALEILKFYSDFLISNELSEKFHENILATLEPILN